MLGEHNDLHEGLSQVGYEDFDRMHRTGRAFRNPRWIPQWALNDKKVRLVVYNYVYNYVSAVMRSAPKPGSSLMELENLARTEARAKLEKRAANPADFERRNIQEHLRTSENGIASRATLLIYKAYRERLKGVDIAEIMEMTPGAVRQNLSRLNKIARRLFLEEDCFPPQHNTIPVSEFKANRRIRYKKYRPASENKALAEKTSIEQVRELAAQYNAGTHLKELSVATGIPIATIYWRLKKFGLISSLRHNKGQFKKRTQVTPELLELAEKRKQGATYVELAATAGITGAAVRYRLVSQGLV